MLQVRVRSPDSPLAARELRTSIVLNGHNDTLKKVGVALVGIKKRLNTEQVADGLAPNTLVLTFRYCAVPLG